LYASKITLADLEALLKKRFGSADQTERFRTELQIRRRKDGESLQCLYNDVTRLMSLAYPGPNSDMTNVVGRDYFLDALGNPSLQVRILERGPTTMEEARRIALNLEALDKSSATEARALVRPQECAKDEGEEKFVRVAAQPVLPSVDESSQAEAVPTFADFAQLLAGFTQCILQF